MFFSCRNAAQASARMARFALIAAAALSLAACGVSRNELKAANAFGKSASALADTVKTAYAQGAQDEADLRAGEFIVSGGEYFRGDRNTIAQFKGRLAAANVLASYGQALSTLLDAKSQNSDIASSIDKLVASVKGLPESAFSAFGIKTSDIDGAGKILAFVFEFYLDEKRREVLQQVVPVMEPIVTRLCLKFRDDFDPKARGFAQVYSNTALAVLRGATKTSAEDFGSRAAAVPMFQRVDTIRARTVSSFAAVREAANSCAKSSKALRDAVNDPAMSLEDIMDFANKAEAAYSVIHASFAKR
jgi:hypothetical protein